MINPATNQRPINKFRLVWALGISQILAWSTTYYLLAVLATPISKETRWSITSVVIGLSWGLLVAGMCSPTAGRKIDRHGGRAVLAISSVLMGLGIGLMGLANTLINYYLAWTLIGVGMAAGLYDAAFSTLGRLFGKTARASMTGLTLLGGFASTIGWPLIAGMEHQIGWRHTCFTLAMIHLVIGLPIHLLAVPKNRNTPVDTDASETNLKVAKPGNSAHRLFLLLAALLTLQSLVISSVSVHLLDVLKLLGVTTATALAIGMMIGPSQVVARVAEYSMGRNLHPTWSTRIAILLCGLGMGLLLTASPMVAFLAMGLYGAGNGILTIARGTLPMALFGAKGYATRMGLLARPMLIAQATGPVAAALILERFGSTTLLVVLCVLVATSLITSLALPTR